MATLGPPPRAKVRLGSLAGGPNLWVGRVDRYGSNNHPDVFLWHFVGSGEVR
jgi:hypothetical protein